MPDHFKSYIFLLQIIRLATHKQIVISFIITNRKTKNKTI